MYLMDRRYRPKSYDGRVVLVRRSLRAMSLHLDRMLSWGDVISGGFDVVEIHGGHGDMFNEPQVQYTAANLAAYLRLSTIETSRRIKPGGLLRSGRAASGGQSSFDNRL
jgi:thioesterase domain-containing protein